MALLNVPSEHGSGTEAPASQYDAVTQSKHSFPPLSFMNLPATQSAHSFWPRSGCTVPGLHSLCTSEPVEHEEPAGQVVHCPLLPSPEVLLNVPSEHGSGADAPASQYEPAAHS